MLSQTLYSQTELSTCIKTTSLTGFLPEKLCLRSSGAEDARQLRYFGVRDFVK